MKTIFKYLSCTLLLCFTSLTVKAESKVEMRNQSVLSSKMVKAIISGLRQEQGLKCKMTADESGEQLIQYIDEDNLNKFIASFLCTDGRSAIIKGTIGDGGQTATESFKLVYAN
jgi:hypothetical protein